MLATGLGGARIDQKVMLSAESRKRAQIPEVQVIMACLAMGRPDDASPPTK